MQCRQCGIEIADKALICYRCGTSTTEAKYQPVPLRRKRASSSWTVMLIVLVIVMLALLVTYLWSNVFSTATRLSLEPSVVSGFPAVVICTATKGNRSSRTVT